MSNAANGEQITTPESREYPDVRSVTVTVVGGSVDVIAAPHTDGVTLEVREVDGPPLTVTSTGGALKISQVADADGQVWGMVKSFLTSLPAGGTDSRAAARLTITVPEDTAVNVRTVGADVLSGGSHGPVTVYSVSGAVTVDHPTGRVDVSTVTGAIDCASPAGELKVKTVSGAVTIHDAVLRTARLNTVSGRTILDLRHGPSLVTANTVSAELSIRLPADGGYDATVSSSMGDVVVDGEPLEEDGTRGGHRHRGDRSVAIKAKTVTGKLVVLRRPGGPGDGPGPVIGGGTSGPWSDVQDEVSPRPGTAGTDGSSHDDGTGPR